MAEMPEKPTLAARLQSVPRPILYLILIVFATLPQFKEIKLPNKPVDASIDFYAALMQVPEGSTVMLSTDWTNGTRAENAGQCEAVLRIVIRRHLKTAFLSIGDPQAPQVFRNEIKLINEEEAKAGRPAYQRWTDWIDLGFYPSGEGTANAINGNLRSAFLGKKNVDDTGQSRDVFQSPVMQKLQTIKDVPLFIDITASNTSVIYIQRLTKAHLAFCVTGVMGPETNNYYASGQLVGLIAGIKGGYDLESLMESGINIPGPDGKIAITSEKYGQIPNFPGQTNFGKGALYYPALHFTILILILAIVVGNVGMLLAKAKKR